MPDLSTPGAQARPIPKGIVARAAEAARYLITGVTPATWFGPMQPLKPMAPEGTAGRAFDYRVGYNLDYQPRSDEPVKFSDLHALADNCDLLRLVIETRKDQIEGQEWDVRPRKLPDGTHPKASQFKAQIADAKAFFAFPDKERDLASWVRSIAEEMFVTDAVSIYVRPDRKNGIYGFDVLDGATISPRIDAWGRTPQAPDVAYQQILHGVPAADFSRDQLIYYPRNKRPGHIYGYSPVEQVVLTANTLIRREMHQLAFYTDGNINDAMFVSPPGWNKDQIAQWDEYWNSLFQGNLAARRGGKWVPNGVSRLDAKSPALADKFDEYLARVICFCFSISPQPFVSMMNRATAESAHDAAIEEGLVPVLNYFRRLFRLLFDRLGLAEIEMVPIDDRETDPKTASDIDASDVKTGIRSRNEVRAGRGLDPVPGGELFTVTTPNGVAPIIPSEGLQPAGEQPGTKPGDPAGDDPHGEPGAKFAKKAGKITRQLPAIKEGDVAKGAREALAERYASAFGSFHEAVRRTVREKLGKAEETPDEKVDGILDDLDWETLNNASLDSSDDLAAVVARASQLQLVQLGLGNAADQIFGVANQRASQWASDHAATLVTQIADSTRSSLRDLIAGDIAEGKTIDEIAADISNLKVGEFPAFGEDRALFIATTEVANANEAGALHGLSIAGEEGAIVKKTWLLGPLPCPICIANAAMGAIPVDAPFIGGVMAPTQHPNCRCALGAEVEESAGAGETDLAAAA